MGVILDDTKILNSVARNDFGIKPDYLDFQYRVTNYEDLLSYTKKYSSVYRGILNLINFKSQGILDWNNNDKITFKNHNLDDHHIFPTRYLQNSSSVDQELIDCVLNRALIPKTTNIKYGKQSPSEYLKTSYNKNPDLGDSLKAHLISPRIIQGFFDDKYEKFLENRANKIIQVINKEIIPLKLDLNREMFGIVT
ncbi:hypothetical protein ACFLTR_03780 [Chloroflexota bacterium]